MSTLTENQVIDIIYSLYETDDTGWDPTSPEYITSRAFCNAAINKWASKRIWRDLFSTLTAAADGTKTTTSGTWAYLCPTNFSNITSWMRTVDSNSNVTFWEVIPPEMVAKRAGQKGKFCYVTGSVKGGFYINFNQAETLTTGHTINYEYYCTPTLYTAVSTTSEIPDPYYCVYYSLARLLKNDGEDFSYEDAMARDLLDQMDTNNTQGVWDVSNQIEEPLSLGVGFGV